MIWIMIGCGVPFKLFHMVRKMTIPKRSSKHPITFRLWWLL